MKFTDIYLMMKKMHIYWDINNMSDQEKELIREQYNILKEQQPRQQPTSQQQTPTINYLNTTPPEGPDPWTFDKFRDFINQIKAENKPLTQQQLNQIDQFNKAIQTQGNNPTRMNAASPSQMNNAQKQQLNNFRNYLDKRGLKNFAIFDPRNQNLLSSYMQQYHTLDPNFTLQLQDLIPFIRQNDKTHNPN